MDRQKNVNIWKWRITGDGEAERTGYFVQPRALDSV